MRLQLAGPGDSQKLINYYKSNPFDGRVTLEINRKSDFFKQYTIQSDDFLTCMLVDEEKSNNIEAMASLIFRKGWIDGKEQTIGYATDLRVSNNRKAILKWSNHFLPTLEEEKKKRDCQHIFSVVARGQSQAYNAFIRPRSTRREMPRYFMYKDFNIISLHGRMPFAPSPLPSIDTRFAQESDMEALTEYISRKMKKKTLSFNSTSEAVAENIKRWGLKNSDFLLAVNKKNRILGCICLWSPIDIEELSPISYDPKTLALKETLQFFSYFGISRRLSNVGQALRYKILSYLLADNPDIFYSLLDKAWSVTNKDEFLLYPYFSGDLLYKPPKSFIHSKVRCGLYCIVPPETQVPDFLKPRVFSDPPDFDLAFI